MSKPCSASPAIGGRTSSLPSANTSRSYANVAGPLAAANVSIFAVSTSDTDYVLVPGESLTAAMEALSASGHEVVSERDLRNFGTTK